MDSSCIIREHDENTATQVTALIMAGASVVAYIIGEGLTDAACIEDETEK